MQLEHIYAHNDANFALFTGADGIFDEAEFNRVRNLLGDHAKRVSNVSQQGVHGDFRVA
jgi:hypothetical protein